MKFPKVAIFFKFTTLLFILNSEISLASNILFFHLHGTASHRTSIWPLATKLADAGHNITYIYPLSNRPGSHPQIEEIEPSLLIKKVDELAGAFDINIRLNDTVNRWLKQVFDEVPVFCETFYNSPETIEWLARPNLTYDLVMMDGGFAQCAYPLVHKFKAKHILFNPITVPGYWDTFGVVPETSSVPEFMLHQKPENLLTSLRSRILNTLAILIVRIAFSGSVKGMETILRNKMNLTDMPSMEEMDQQTSLVLHNTYFIEDYPMSLPPMFVSYSGLSCTEKSIKERKPLPQNLETFMNEEETEGFVYISFGSSVNASAMPESLLSEFTTAFAAFPNLRFLWRWTGVVPESMPQNVLLQSWFPQLDVLAHPKVKAFVSQAGRPSVQEALCYGVPMITIPIFADQDFDSDRLENIGAAVSLDITSLTAQDLVNAFEEIVYGNKYRERVKELSRMFRDRPMDPVDYVHYWVEYVLRHNTSLLKPLAMQQTWWQRRLLDVYAIIWLIILTIFSIVGILMYKIVKIIGGRLGFLKKDSVKIKIE